MSRLARTCTRLYGEDTWPVLVFLLHVGMVLRFAHIYMFAMDSDTQVTKSTLLNIWLMIVLIAFFVVWVVMVRRGLWSHEGGVGLRLAGYGLLCRVYCDFLVFGVAAEYGLVYAGESEVETYGGFVLRGLIGAHRWGGLLAFAAGLICFSLGTAGPRRRGRPPAAAPRRS